MSDLGRAVDASASFELSARDEVCDGMRDDLVDDVSEDARDDAFLGFFSSLCEVFFWFLAI